jgi:hypothetical protein
LGSFGQWWSAFVTQHTGSGSQQEQLAGALRDVETLKKTVGDLAAAQQQISLSIASLRPVSRKFDNGKLDTTCALLVLRSGEAKASHIGLN